ncbi:type II secretion system secretin GspD [Oceanicoccus sagamiensis]|uniref:Type II secretion system protein GspD n=1 Tax=Oceanicoccus sagamiensis TaxID=716816 RepID=A0A1X9NEJ5_9GAMM|nr:type II secretion system secretin GspD [Oceanicoccus sagamiensis]ARN75591.1 type II secretion system protein GspD [Oceanicoccus sagamiensis]
MTATTQPLFRQLISLVLLLTCLLQTTYAAEKVTMNMRDADIRALIQWVADNTGKNIVVHRAVQGNVTVLSPAPLTTDEAYQVFLSVLQINGYAIIETPEALKIVPKALATKGALPAAGSSASADMVVSLLTIENIPAQRMAELLRPLMSSEAVLTPYPATNALVMADHARNIQSAQDIVKQLDKASENSIELVTLKHADAVSVLQSLSALIPTGGAGAMDITVSADERSNSILLAGDPAKRNQFKKLIAQLDTPLNGQGNTQVVYLNYVDAKEVLPILQSLAKSIQATQKDQSNTISIESSESANALVINAPPAMLTTMKGVIAKLDIRRAQVLVEALLVEVSGDIANDVGVTWITNPDNEFVGAVNTLGDLPLANPAGDDSPLAFTPGRGFTFGYFDNGDLQAAIRALNATQNANVLSTPTIVAIDNEEASLLVGQNVPFKTGQSTSSASSTSDPFTTIERQDIGISLVVTPRINQGDSITLEIQQKTESIAPSIDVASDIITNKREIITKALIKDDQVLVLGGLISEEETEIQEKVPFLGDLPLVGKLFSSTGKTNSKKNLMVFIHPTILKDEDHINDITQRRYNFMRGLQQQVNSKEWKVDPDDTAVLEEFDTFSPVNK